MWSAGILLYQMLFGRRPFGHDQTQERILSEDTIIKARKVEFPSRPSVSNEAKVTSSAEFLFPTQNLKGFINIQCILRFVQQDTYIIKLYF